MKVNVVGDSLVDISFGLPRQFIHRYQQAAKIELPFGEKLSTESYTITPGGSGANVAIGLTRAGFSVSFYTGLADDVFGNYLERSLKQEKVGLITEPGGDQTPLSVILRVGGERTIITGRNHGSSFPNPLPDEHWLHLGPLHGQTEPFFASVLSHQVRSGQELSLNPSIESLEARGRSLMTLLRSVSILVVNLHEALTLTRLPHRTVPAEVIQAAKRLGPQIVCLTDGERGAYVTDGNLILQAQALITKHERLDATGAGDGFTTGFLAAYLTNRDELAGEQLLRAALAAGVANSAAVVNEIGGQAGLLSLEDMAEDGNHVKIKVVT